MSGSVSSATTANGIAGTASAQKTISGDFNTFLKMLTTQLQNQDPTNAMDPTQMTNQLVSFAQVEQQISMNTNLNALISLQQSQALTTGANLVGREIELSGTSLPLQDGSGALRLPAAGVAQAARVQIVDRNGSVLRTETVALGSSPSRWSWNGRTDAGAKLPDGEYSFVVNGLTAAGAAAPITATALGTATGVQRRENTLNLMFGTTAAGMDRVVSVD